jgi:hypothetical protein
MNDRQASSLLVSFASTSINPILHLLRLSHQKNLLAQIQVTPHAPKM